MALADEREEPLGGDEVMRTETSWMIGVLSLTRPHPPAVTLRTPHPRCPSSLSPSWEDTAGLFRNQEPALPRHQI